MVTQPDKPRVLIFSLRNIFGKALFRCPHFEFEDIIGEIDSAELLAPKVDPSSLRARIATGLAYSDCVEPGHKKNIAKAPLRYSLYDLRISARFNHV